MYRACVCNILFLVHPINQYCSCESSSTWFRLWSQVDSLPTTCNWSWISPTLWVFSSHYSSGRRSMWNILDTNPMQKINIFVFPSVFLWHVLFAITSAVCEAHHRSWRLPFFTISCIQLSLDSHHQHGGQTYFTPTRTYCSLCGIMVLLTE